MADVQNFQGIITAIPAVAGKCGMIIAPGAEPTVPEPGGVWYDINDDAMAYFAPDGTITYLPKGTGTSGQVLTSNGAGIVPTYKTASSGLLTLQSKLGGASVSNVTTEQQVANQFDALATGILNVVVRKMVVEWSGDFTTIGGQTPAISLIFELDGVDIATITSEAVTASVTAGQFNCKFTFTTTNIGASAFGYVTAELTIDLAGTGVYTTYRSIVARSSVINLTAAGIKPRLNVTANSTLASIETTTGWMCIYPASA